MKINYVFLVIMGEFSTTKVSSDNTLNNYNSTHQGKILH